MSTVSTSADPPHAMPLNQALILVGGKGTRLGAHTAHRPKPMMEVGARPFLQQVIEEVARHGITDIVLLCGHMAGHIVEAFEGMVVCQARVRCVTEPCPMGTAGAITQVSDSLQEQFLLLNGDSFFDLNLLDLPSLAPGSDWLGKVALRPLADTGRYGTVGLAGEQITSFAEKAAQGPGLINGGVYLLRRDVLQDIVKVPCSLETELLPKLVDRGRLFGRAYPRYFIDIGIPEDLKRAQAQLPLRRPALFFDRDGVLNQDAGYTHREQDFRWMPGAPEAIRHCNDQGWLVIVVTNQAGIARGYYDAAAVEQLHGWMQAQLQAIGAHIDAFYYCPHHPEGTVAALTMTCDCRKPQPGMLRQALRDWPQIDPARSRLIGDKPSDIEAAQRAGLEGCLFEGQDLLGLVTRLVLPASIDPAPQGKASE